MHTKAEEAAQLAKRAGVSKLLIMHFSRRYTDVKPLLKEARAYFRKTEVAEDFMKIKLK